TDDLLKLDRTDAVYVELLFRRGVRDEYRREALTGLAKSQKKKELAVLVETIRAQDGSKSAQDESVAFDLVRLLTSRDAAELKEARPEMEKRGTESATPLTRELGYVALIAADDTVDKAWALALKSAPALQDLVNAMPLVRDPAQRAQLYQKVEPLLDGLPKEVKVDSTKEVKGRYVRVELPGQKKTL